MFARRDVRKHGDRARPGPVLVVHLSCRDGIVSEHGPAVIVGPAGRRERFRPLHVPACPHVRRTFRRVQVGPRLPSGQDQHDRVRRVPVDGRDHALDDVRGRLGTNRRATARRVTACNRAPPDDRTGQQHGGAARGQRPPPRPPTAVSLVRGPGQAGWKLGRDAGHLGLELFFDRHSLLPADV